MLINDVDTNAIAATVSSGIRSTFCYAPSARVQEWEPELIVNPEFIPAWAVEQVEELIKAGPYGNGRVNVGLAFDSLFLPTEIVADLYKRVRQAGAKVITSHYCRGAVFGEFCCLYGSPLHIILEKRN
jgi:hypothetical protein